MDSCEWGVFEPWSLIDAAYAALPVLESLFYTVGDGHLGLFRNFDHGKSDLNVGGIGVGCMASRLVKQESYLHLASMCHMLVKASVFVSRRSVLELDLRRSDAELHCYTNGFLPLE